LPEHYAGDDFETPGRAGIWAVAFCWSAHYQCREASGEFI
jgi:hypothetical protein